MLGMILLAAVCNAGLWAHVYKPERFKIIKPCVTVTAVLTAKRAEADGDWHLRLNLTTEDRWMLNEKNKERQGDNLVGEVICAGKVTQADAIEPCKGFVNRVKVPKLGAIVLVTGPLVLDQEGGHGWMELHPITSIRPALGRKE